MLGAIINVVRCKKYGIKRGTAAASTLVVGLVVYAWMLLYNWALTGFTAFGEKSMMRIMIFIPLAVYLIAKLFRIDFNSFSDMCVTGNLWVSMAAAKFACIFVGCCRGYPSAFGIYNPVKGITLFPIQLFDTFFFILLGIVFILMSKEKNYRCDGTFFPTFMILYGIIAFLLEFARDNEKILLGCSADSFHALFLALVGIIYFVIIKRNSAKPEIAEETFLNSENI